MTYIERTHKPSLAGVSIVWKGGVVTSGRVSRTISYPYIDRSDFDPLGLDPDQFEDNIFLYGDHHDVDLKTIQAAFDSDEPITYVHPWYGPKKVIPKTRLKTIKEQTENAVRLQVTLEVESIEKKKKPRPDAAKVKKSISNASDAASAAISEDIDTESLPSPDLVSEVAGSIKDAARVVGQVNRKIESTLNVTSPLVNALRELDNEADSLARTPQKISSKINELIAVTKNTVSPRMIAGKKRTAKVLAYAGSSSTRSTQSFTRRTSRAVPSPTEDDNEPGTRGTQSERATLGAGTVGANTAGSGVSSRRGGLGAPPDEVAQIYEVDPEQEFDAVNAGLKLSASSGVAPRKIYDQQYETPGTLKAREYSQKIVGFAKVQCLLNTCIYIVEMPLASRTVVEAIKDQVIASFDAIRLDDDNLLSPDILSSLYDAMNSVVNYLEATAESIPLSLTYTVETPHSLNMIAHFILDVSWAPALFLWNASKIDDPGRIEPGTVLEYTDSLR